ncbi:OLC1v1035558C1 [Oldenlandia corymbosa var. corymbosa]|uniref:OLC1v1035558C1 n=1 Tax=Oldenlandia corymbosa var. corymbosa TaxID=529605 RepID=A0AAV1CWF9_OLDCO|nr:OLC1v1035558C1 [Oldenlandia corymbosa var. corymbosa]
MALSEDVKKAVDEEVDGGRSLAVDDDEGEQRNPVKRLKLMFRVADDGVSRFRIGNPQTTPGSEIHGQRRIVIRERVAETASGSERRPPRKVITIRRRVAETMSNPRRRGGQVIIIRNRLPRVPADATLLALCF